MENLDFKGYMIAKNIDLKKINHYFYNTNKIQKRSNNVILYDNEISNILGYTTYNKKVYIFNHGVVVFVNVTAEERKKVFIFLEGLYLLIDNDLQNKYNDFICLNTDFQNVYLENDSNFCIKYDENIILTVANIIARSIALEKIENDLNELLDNSESYLDKLQKSKLLINFKSMCEVGSKILRFQYESMRNIEILNKSNNLEQNDISKETYNYIYKYYELDTRFYDIKNKTSELKKIFKTYNKFSFNEQNEKRDKFEIVLLALFPLLGVILYFM